MGQGRIHLQNKRNKKEGRGDGAWVICIELATTQEECNAHDEHDEMQNDKRHNAT